MKLLPALARILTVAYPLVLHYCVLTGQVTVAAYYLSMLLALPILTTLLERRAVRPFSIATLLLAIGLLTVLQTHELIIFKILPVIIHLALFFMFAFSLKRNNTPVITRIAAAIRPSLSDDEVTYTRSVTIMWAVFFLAMALISGYLAVFSSVAVWSLFVNVVSYGLIALVFLAEFQLRRRVLREQVDSGFAKFLIRLSQENLKKLFWLK